MLFRRIGFLSPGISTKKICTSIGPNLAQDREFWTYGVPWVGRFFVAFWRLGLCTCGLHICLMKLFTRKICTLIDSNLAHGRQFWTSGPMDYPELLDLFQWTRFRFVWRRSVYKWLRRDVKHMGFSEGLVSACGLRTCLMKLFRKLRFPSSGDMHINWFELSSGQGIVDIRVCGLPELVDLLQWTRSTFFEGDRFTNG